MNVNSDYEILNKFFRDKLRNVHTIKPCVVTKVNDFTVDARPLTSTRYRDGVQLPLPTLKDIPLMIYSGRKGGARVTVPVAEGDTVLVLCSDRDFGELLDSSVNIESIFPSQEVTPLELYPLMAIPCFFTSPEGKPIDKTNIVVENGSTRITIGKDGDIDLETTASVNVDANSGISLTTGGNITMTAGGTVDITATAMNVTAPFSATTVDSDNTSLDGHTHPYTWTDPAGSGNTGTPN